jgi:hypothetical protein
VVAQEEKGFDGWHALTLRRLQGGKTRDC